MERIICTCGEYCNFTTCKVKFISRSIATANVIGTLKKPISAMRDSMKSYYKFSNNEYRPMLINYEYDFCDLQEGLYDSPLHTVLMKGFANYTNINRKCPFPPGEYYVKGLNLEARHLPSIIPAGRYLVNLTTYVQNHDWLYNISVYFSCTNYGTLDTSLG